MKSGFKGVIFDMDGTLTRPCLDFRAMRREVGILSGDLIEEINRLPKAARDRAWSVVESHERKALENMVPQDGVADLLNKCKRNRIRLGIVTRNLGRSVQHFCGRFGVTFDTVVTREFPSVKPHPGPVLHILKEWAFDASDTLTVGDYVDDITAGRAAGTRTCFFQNPGKPFYGGEADYSVSSMEELDGIIFPRVK